MNSVVPPFEPHPLLRGGHIQTIAGRYLPGRPIRLQASQHEIPLEDGDRLSILDSIPAGWHPGDPAAILLHGLSGCARAPYATRLTDRLVRLGVRAVRMNLRGAGSGFGLARGIYHGGRTEDVRAVVKWTAERSSGSPIALIGFSLGGNLALKLSAEAVDEPLTGLDCVLAASPPLDLAASCRQIQRDENRLYNRNFLRALRGEVARLHAAFPELGSVDLSRVTSLYEFDNVYTAPRNGFANAEDYYTRSSAGPLLPRIALPGLVVHAEDDPFIPLASILQCSFPPQLRLELIPKGGHMGFISRSPWNGDRRWLDSRLAAWLIEHWGLNGRGNSHARPSRVLNGNPEGGSAAYAHHQTE